MCRRERIKQRIVHVRALFMALLMFGCTAGARAAGLPSDVDAALLRGEWEKVFEALKDVELEKSDAVTRLVAAHACLATNSGFRATPVFASLSHDDLEHWLRWTTTLAEGNHDSPAVEYLRADALARAAVPAPASMSAALPVEAGSVPLNSRQ